MSHQRYPEGYMVVVHSLTRRGVPSPGLVQAGSSGANDHPPAPHPQAGGRLHQAPPLRRGLGTPYGNDRGAWTGWEVVIIPHQG